MVYFFIVLKSYLNLKYILRIATLKSNGYVVDVSELKQDTSSDYVEKYSIDVSVDPFFHERRISLTNTMQSLENGSMKTVDFNTSIDELIAVYIS